jgi:xanthine dehydrogenase molybdopterin-binding subunit B
MGLGFHTSEEVMVDADSGRLITDGTWEYKVPAASCIPQQLNITFLKARSVTAFYSCQHRQLRSPSTMIGQVVWTNSFDVWHAWLKTVSFCTDRRLVPLRRTRPTGAA